MLHSMHSLLLWLNINTKTSNQLPQKRSPITVLPGQTTGQFKRFEHIKFRVALLANENVYAIHYSLSDLTWLGVCFDYQNNNSAYCFALKNNWDECLDRSRGGHQNSWRKANILMEWFILSVSTHGRISRKTLFCSLFKLVDRVKANRRHVIIALKVICFEWLQHETPKKKTITWPYQDCMPFNPVQQPAVLAIQLFWCWLSIGIGNNQPTSGTSRGHIRIEKTQHGPPGVFSTTQVGYKISLRPGENRDVVSELIINLPLMRSLN